MSKRPRDESSPAPTSTSSASSSEPKVEVETEAEGKLEKKSRTTAVAVADAQTVETVQVVASVQATVDAAAEISKRINQFLNKLSSDQDPIPFGKDLASLQYSRGGSNTSCAPLSVAGLKQLEHFLCTTYPMKSQLELLKLAGGVNYARYYNHSGKTEAAEAGEVTEVGILKLILEEATQLLLSKEQSVADCFLGFIQWNNEAGAPQSRSDIPDYDFFMAVMSYASHRLPVKMMQQMLRSMVHEESNIYDLDELTIMLSNHFDGDTPCPDDHDDDDDVDGGTFSEEEVREEKDKVYKQLKGIFEDEVEVMGINVYGDSDDEGEGDSDDDGEGDETD